MTSFFCNRNCDNNEIMREMNNYNLRNFKLLLEMHSMTHAVKAAGTVYNSVCMYIFLVDINNISTLESYLAY